MDGTLVDSQHVIAEAMAIAFADQGFEPPPPTAVKRVVGLHLEEAIARLLDEAAESAVDALAARYRQAFFASRSRPDHVEPLFPGVRETLAQLDRPEVILAIATGKNRRGLLAALERQEIGHHFTILKTADDGPGKPNPHILIDAMAEAGAEPHETVMIGDTVFDMAMARNAAVPAVGVGWGYHEADELAASGARIVIDRLHDLPPTLQSLGDPT